MLLSHKKEKDVKESRDKSEHSSQSLMKNAVLISYQVRTVMKKPPHFHHFHSFPPKSSQTHCLDPPQKGNLCLALQQHSQLHLSPSLLMNHEIQLIKNKPRSPKLHFGYAALLEPDNQELHPLSARQKL